LREFCRVASVPECWGFGPLQLGEKGAVGRGTSEPSTGVRRPPVVCPEGETATESERDSKTGRESDGREQGSKKARDKKHRLRDTIADREVEAAGAT
jgi:hypothetical protein